MQKNDLSRILKHLKQIENNSWLAEVSYGMPRFVKDTDVKFWKEVLFYSCIPRQQLGLWIMYLDNRPISFCFTIKCGKVWHIIANQYDKNYKKYMTGSILYLEMMTQGFRNRVKYFDFGDGDISYKKKWGAVESHHKVTSYMTSRKHLTSIFKIAIYAIKYINNLKKRIFFCYNRK